MDSMTTQITSLAIVYSTVHSGSNQRKHQSSASPAFVRGIHREPVNSLNPRLAERPLETNGRLANRRLNYPHKGPVTRKMFPFDDVIMVNSSLVLDSSAFRGHVVWNHIEITRKKIHQRHLKYPMIVGRRLVSRNWVCDGECLVKKGS